LNALKTRNNMILQVYMCKYIFTCGISNASYKFVFHIILLSGVLETDITAKYLEINVYKYEDMLILKYFAICVCACWLQMLFNISIL